MIYHSRGEHSNYYTTDVVKQYFKIIIPYTKYRCTKGIKKANKLKKKNSIRNKRTNINGVFSFIKKDFKIVGNADYEY